MVYEWSWGQPCQWICSTDECWQRFHVPWRHHFLSLNHMNWSLVGPIWRKRQNDVKYITKDYNTKVFFKTESSQPFVLSTISLRCPILGVTRHISMAQCKTAVTPLLTQWSYFSLALNHLHDINYVKWRCSGLPWKWVSMKWCFNLKELYKILIVVMLLNNNSAQKELITSEATHLRAAR